MAKLERAALRRQGGQKRAFAGLGCHRHSEGTCSSGGEPAAGVHPQFPNWPALAGLFARQTGIAAAPGCNHPGLLQSLWA